MHSHLNKWEYHGQYKLSDKKNQRKKICNRCKHQLTNKKPATEIGAIDIFRRQ